MKKILFCSVLISFCLMLSCNSPATPDNPTATSVTVTSPNSAITVGETEQMTATITMSNGTTKAATGTWSSNNTSVATVNQSGLVTGIAAGNVTISINTTGIEILEDMANSEYSGAAGSITDSDNIDALASVSGTAKLKDRTRLYGPMRFRAKDNMIGAENLDETGSVRNLNRSGAAGYAIGVESLNTTVDSQRIENIAPTANLHGSKTLTIRNIWGKGGKGNYAFDMPTYITRVRIKGEYYGYSSNFIVHINGKLVVNELLGTFWGQKRYDGVHATNGGLTEITYSSGVVWQFIEVPRSTAITNVARNITNLLGKSISGNREYEIYKRVAAENDDRWMP